MYLQFNSSFRKNMHVISRLVHLQLIVGSNEEEIQKCN
jgi:hypothetical protein